MRSAVLRAVKSMKMRSTWTGFLLLAIILAMWPSLCMAFQRQIGARDLTKLANIASWKSPKSWFESTSARLRASMNLPNWWDAPRTLLEMDGHCGLLAAWMVLKHFRKRVSVQALARDSSYTKRHGVFTIGLATCLKIHGLRVSFHTEPDPKIGGFERRCYARAARMGILPQPAVDLSSLAVALRRGEIPIVLFNLESGVPHFSPYTGTGKGKVRLPLADGEAIPKDRFLTRWSEPGILRQCVVAGV